jgi:hypothetical protein
LELAQPGLDDRRPDAPKLPLAEVAAGVEAEPQLGGLPGALVEGLGGEAPLGELGKGDLAGRGIDVGAPQHVGADGDDEAFGVLLAGEGAGPLVAVGVVVAGLPAAAPPVTVGADPPTPDGLLPQVLDMCHRTSSATAQRRPGRGSADGRPPQVVQQPGKATGPVFLLRVR